MEAHAEAAVARRAFEIPLVTDSDMPNCLAAISKPVRKLVTTTSAPTALPLARAPEPSERMAGDALHGGRTGLVQLAERTAWDSIAIQNMLMRSKCLAELSADEIAALGTRPRSLWTRARSGLGPAPLLQGVGASSAVPPARLAGCRLTRGSLPAARSAGCRRASGGAAFGPGAQRTNRSTARMSLTR
jgi:hypothetical protein